MPIPLKGESALTIDGEERRLLFSAAALLEAEEASGVGILSMLDGGLDNLKLVAELMRAGLRHGCGMELSRVEAADLIIANPEAGQALLKALGVALPDEEELPAGPPKAAKRSGTGKTS